MSNTSISAKNSDNYFQHHNRRVDSEWRSDTLSYLLLSSRYQTTPKHIITGSGCKFDILGKSPCRPSMVFPIGNKLTFLPNSWDLSSLIIVISRPNNNVEIFGKPTFRALIGLKVLVKNGLIVYTEFNFYIRSRSDVFIRYHLAYFESSELSF